MSFRTFHFDGVVRVPGYVEWVIRLRHARDLRATTGDVLRLLQWHCPPSLWHLKTPVHMFALECLPRGLSGRQVPVEPPRSGQGAGVGVQPHRLRPELEQRPRGPRGLGAEQLAWWAEGMRRAMDFRRKVGDDRFVDVSFTDLQTDPVNTLPAVTSSSVLSSPTTRAAKVQEWADGHKPGHRGAPTLRAGRLRADPGAGTRCVQ